MAYTSDFRFKNYIKDIDFDVRNKLQEQGIATYPDLRIFEESHEDSILFDKGGLTFTFPGTNIKFGSNDAGWCIGQDPLVIIEGTYGTERGQFGDGQLNRFSHSTGVAINGFIGITLMPFFGESYATNGSTPIGIDQSIKLKYAKIHKGFLKGAITVNKIESGKFLVIDIYDRDLIINIVIEAFKEKLSLQNNLNSLVQQALGKMELEVKDFSYAERSNQFLTSLYSQDGKLLSNFSRMYTQNFDALTKSEKRDGHGLFGKNLIESYLSGDDNYYAIFIRMNADDIANLAKRNQKEFTFLLKSKKINVRCLDDLLFSDPSLEERTRNIKQLNLLHNKQTDLIKELNLAFIKKEILLRN
jgi:hypothetical protein